MVIFVFKQKTAYEMRISDWSSDVCSSDLGHARTLIGCNDAESLAQQMIGRGLNVRQAERLVQNAKKAAGGAAHGGPSKEAAGDQPKDTDKIGRASWRERGGEYV